MQGLDIETTALNPADGEIRLVQIRDGDYGRVYDVGRSESRADAAEAKLRKLGEAVAHNADLAMNSATHGWNLRGR
jgi:hypothetical protein